MCSCIIGYQEGVDESWLVYLNSKNKEIDSMFGVKFNYCPLCGCKLNPEDFEEESKND